MRLIKLSGSEPSSKKNEGGRMKDEDLSFVLCAWFFEFLFESNKRQAQITKLSLHPSSFRLHPSSFLLACRSQDLTSNNDSLDLRCAFTNRAEL
jgi:hypothetical protein